MLHRLVGRLAPPRDELTFGFSTLAVFAVIIAFAVLRLAQTAPIDP